jgi:nucleotide-binding universal stress UspA family protein
METLKILIPTDFSQQADFAWLMAKKLGEKIPVAISFLHVLNPGQGVITDTEGRPVEDGELDPVFFREMEKIAHEKLQALRKSTGAEVHLKIGKVTDGLVEFAEANNFHLVVMGTKGASGWKEMLSGTETQRIVRHSKVPVLSMMCDRSDLQIRNILLVHDYEKEKTGEFHLLKAIAEAWGAKVHLLYIAKSGKHDEVKSKMEEFAVQQGIKNFETHIHDDASVEKGVVHFNQMHDMDLICIGTHGHSGFAHLFRESIAESMVNHLFKPIITYHLKQR